MGGVGLAWYRVMLALPRMQTQYGSVEASSVNATDIAPLLTWDTKVTTVLAMLGGTAGLAREHLRSDGLLERFNSTVTDFYTREFGGLLAGEDIALRLPPDVPTGANFPSCACGGAGDPHQSGLN